MASSSKKVWWRCSKGHEWQTIVKDRNNGNRCPYCSHQRLLARYNDLATINPSVAKEWNYEKNGDLTPDMVTASSGKKVWWRCPCCGKEWQAKISDMNRKENKCSICSKNKR